MYFYTLSLIFIFSHFSLFSTNNLSINGTDEKTLSFYLRADLDCPWNTQHRHNEQECGNCKNSKNDVITEYCDLEDKRVIITRKSNFEITSFVTSVLKEAVQIGLQRCETVENKKKLITRIAYWFNNVKSHWLSLYKDSLSQNSAKIQLLECAYKQNCSIYLYKTEKKPTHMLQKPKIFNLKLPITSFYDHDSRRDVITAPNGKVELYSLYSADAISRLFDIFVLTTIPSKGSKAPFKVDIKYYFWDYITDFLDQKLKTLDK